MTTARLLKTQSSDLLESAEQCSQQIEMTYTESRCSRNLESRLKPAAPAPLKKTILQPISFEGQIAFKVNACKYIP